MRTANFVASYQWILPVLFGLIFILLVSFIKEPVRQKTMALLIAGAGAAYLSGGGFGMWELGFCTAMTVVAFFGLHSYRFIGIGWLLHTAWDLLHHFYGNPILPFDLTSSLGCAIFDPVLALWCFGGAPSLWEILRKKRVRATPLSA